MVIQESSNVKMPMHSVFLNNNWNISRKSLAVVTMGALLAVGGYASSAFATKSVNTISGEVTISSSLNVTIPSSTVSLNLNPLNTDFDSSNLNVTISTNTPSNNDTSIVTFAAKADNTQAAGTYLDNFNHRWYNYIDTHVSHITSFGEYAPDRRVKI